MDHSRGSLCPSLFDQPLVDTSQVESHDLLQSISVPNLPAINGRVFVSSRTDGPAPLPRALSYHPSWVAQHHEPRASPLRCAGAASKHSTPKPLWFGGSPSPLPPRLSL
jgi:hypothetical protein